jgi:JmjC domain, hydroxylase
MNVAVEGDATQKWYFIHYTDGIKVEKHALQQGVEVPTMFPNLEWLKQNKIPVYTLEQRIGDIVVLSDQFFHFGEVLTVSERVSDFIRAAISPPWLLGCFLCTCSTRASPLPKSWWKLTLARLCRFLGVL